MIEKVGSAKGNRSRIISPHSAPVIPNANKTVVSAPAVPCPCGSICRTVDHELITAAVTVRLTKGFVALIDLADADRVLARKWRVRIDVDGRPYAIGQVPGLPDVAEPMHRFIMGAQRGQIVDHRSGDTLDNRRVNLRICTNRENVCNSKKYSSGSTSRFKGVTRRPNGRWRANIYVNYKTVSLGVFIEEIDAARAYDRAARHHFGAFARLNFPEAE